LGLRQTLWIGLGMAILLAVLRGPGDLRWLRRYRHVWLSAGLLLTASPCSSERILVVGSRACG
jgi:hypothetical protein